MVSCLLVSCVFVICFLWFSVLFVINILGAVNSVVHVRVLVVLFMMFWFDMTCLVSLCILLVAMV